MKFRRGWLVLALCSLFFGHSDSKAQGVYFINTSWVDVDVTIDASSSVGVGTVTYTQTLTPGEFLLVDGNVFFDQIDPSDYYSYSWFSSDPTSSIPWSGGQLDLPDINSHYSQFGPVLWVPVTRGSDELAVGRAVITNSSQNNYQFQGQQIPPGETVAFLTPASATMWNTRWEEVQRFGTLVTQPNELQYTNNYDWRPLDWQEAMMWWGGQADPIQWAWYEWTGQSFDHLGNELEGAIPAGAGVATPPVNPVNPNWPQVLTGNTDPPTTFTPAAGGGPTTPPGGGGSGGGGTGGGGSGGGVGTGTINNGTLYIELPDDYAREPTLQVATNLLSTIDEDTGKIRQHTWGTNQRLDDVIELLGKPDESVEQAAIDSVEGDFNQGMTDLDSDYADAAGTSFFDLLLNNLPADGQGAVVLDGLQFNSLEISPRMDPWGNFLPWVKGIILIACTIACFHHIWETFRDTAHRVALTQGQNGNGVAGAGFDADNVFALANYGVSMTALLAFLGVCALVVATFMGTAVLGEVNTFVTAGLAGGNESAQYVAICADWLYAVVPVHGMLGLLAAKATASVAIFAAGMTGHAGMKAALS